MAMKMSSPKNSPILSVAAAIAGHARRRRVATPCASAAASAIGATSGRTRLRMAGDRGQAERGGDLAEQQIADQQPPDRRAAQLARSARRARSCSPSRSSSPITGSTMQTTVT